jgi:hypothetical protein
MYDITRMLPPSFRLFLAGASFAEYMAQRVLNDYRGPGFLAVVLFGSSPTPSPLSRQLARSATHRKTEKERQVADRRREKGVVG